MLRARRLDDPVLLVGADQLADFPTWKEPEAVLGLARLAVAARPGFTPTDPQPGITFFEMEPTPISSTEIRRRVAAGESTDGFLSPAVAAEIELPRSVPGLESRAIDSGDRTELTSLEQARRIAGIAQEKLARDVVILDMRPVCTYTDYFVICSGGNPRQTKAIYDEVAFTLKQDGRVLPGSVGGVQEGDVDRGRLPRRRAARLHAGDARLLQARGALVGRALDRGRRHRLSPSGSSRYRCLL